MITADVASASERPSDLTIRQIHRRIAEGGADPSFPGPPSERIEYVQHDRKRTEHQGWTTYRLRRNGRTRTQLGPRIASVTRCDLKQGFQLNFDDREYTASPLPSYPSREEVSARTTGAANFTPPEPTFAIEIETLDTGERQNLFGYPARHVITTRRTIPMTGSRQTPGTTRTDGWYIDLNPCLSCDPWWHASPRAGHAWLSDGREPHERPIFKESGEPERGYMLRGTMTSTHAVSWPDGSLREFESINEFEVTELSTKPLDPTLFEIPVGFRLVESIRQNPRPTLGILWKGKYDRLDYRLRRLVYLLRRASKTQS